MDFGSSAWRTVLPVLYSRRCYSSGHEDTSRSLSHVTVHTSELGFVHSLLKGSNSFSFHGRLKHCPHCYTFPCSYSLPAWSCSCATLTSRFSSWCCHGSAFAQLCTDASRSCRSFVTTARTIHHLRRWYGPLLLGYYMSSLRFVGGFTLRFAMVVQFFGGWRAAITNCSCRACRGPPRKLLSIPLQRPTPAPSCGHSTVWTKTMNWSASFPAYPASADRKWSTILCPIFPKSKSGSFLRD